MLITPLLCQLSAICALGAMADFMDYTQNDSKRREAGDVGEKKVQAILQNITNLKFIDNLVFQHNGQTVQIDHVLLGSDRLYCLETKNWKGLLKGEIDEQSWTLTKKNGKVSVHYNPLLQNERQTNLLKQLTGVPVEGLVIITNSIEHSSGKLPWGIIRANRAKVVINAKLKKPSKNEQIVSEQQLQLAWQKILDLSLDKKQIEVLKIHMNRLFEKYVSKTWRIWITGSLAFSAAAMVTNIIG